MNINDVIAEKIAAARARAEANKRRRTALAASRQRGLALRHAQRLRNQANRGDTPTDDDLRGAEAHAGVGQQPTTVTEMDTTVAQTATVADDKENQ
jgi:hypothetical protein